MTIAMGETHIHTHTHSQMYSWECKIQKRIQMEMKTMLEAKTKRKLATMTKWKQQTIVGVCVCTIYAIRYTIYDTHTCSWLTKDVSFTMFDWWKINDFFAVAPFGTVAPFLSQVKVLHAVRLNERLTFKTFRLRQRPNQFGIYPKMARRNYHKWLQMVYRAIYHSRTIISQHDRSQSNWFQIKRKPLIYNFIPNVDLFLSLPHIARLLGPSPVQVNLVMHRASFESQMQLHKFIKCLGALHLVNRIRFWNAAA